MLPRIFLFSLFLFWQTLPTQAAGPTFALDDNGNTSQYYLPITITNSKPSAMAVGSAYLISAFNSSTYAAVEASDLSNVNFQDGKGNLINSWLESGETDSSTATNYFIKLPSAIAASGGTLTIYMVFASTSQSSMSGTHTGAEPNYTSTYGQYDNGAVIFTQYGGKSWATLTPVGGSWNTTNGYLQQTSTTGTLSGGTAALVESTSYAVTGSYIIETAFNYNTQSIARVGLIANATVASGDVNGYRFVGQQNNNGAGFLSFLNDVKAWVVSNTYNGSTGTNYTMSVTDNAGTWSGTLYSGYGIGGTALTTMTATAYTTTNNQNKTSGYVGVSAAYYDGTNVVGNPTNFQWFRMRTYPPSGTMPSYVVGTLRKLGVGFFYLP